MVNPILPKAQSGLVERVEKPTGSTYEPTREWYEFFRRLLQFVLESGADPGVIQSILDRLDELEQNGNNFSIQGLMSVDVFGTPAGGVVQIQLEGDVQAPGNTYYYGTGPTGVKGFFTVESAIAAGVAITKTVGLDGVTTISHADTSSVANLVSDNSNGVVLQDITITFDAFGHVQTATVGTVDLDARYGPALATGGTTAQFWRGDKSWNNVLTGPFQATNITANNGRLDVSGTVSADPFLFRADAILANNNTTQQQVIRAQANIQPTGATLSNLFGLIFFPMISNSATTITSVGAMHCSVGTQGSFTGTIGSIQLIRGADPGAAVTTTVAFRGLLIDNFVNVTSPNIRGAELNLNVGTGIRHNVYAQGTAPNYFRGNVGVNTTTQFGTGDGVLGFGNAVTPPTTNPVGGNVAWAEGGALKARTAGGNIATVVSNAPARVMVYSKADLPAPVAGVITGANNVRYDLAASVDLTGDRFVAGTNTTISGNSLASTQLTSTGLPGGSALFTSTSSIQFENIGLSAPTGRLFDLNDSTGDLLLTGVNITNTPTIGTTQNYGNIVIENTKVIASANWTVTGTIGSFAIFRVLLNGLAGQSTLIFPAAANVTRRISLLYAAIDTPATGTGLNVSTTATIADESYNLDNCVFTGAGAPLAGLDYTSNKSLFYNNSGITNTSVICQYSMTGNATATVIAATGTFVKIAGTTTASSLNQKFTTATTQRATYAGVIADQFRVSAVASMTSGNNQTIRMRVAKNGTTIAESQSNFKTTGSGDASSVFCQTFVSLAPTDFIEVFITNDTATTNITVSDLNVNVVRM